MFSICNSVQVKYHNLIGKLVIPSFFSTESTSVEVSSKQETSKFKVESDLSVPWGNKVYNELPVVTLKAKKNNTIVALNDCNGRTLALSSCGIEGFTNARKNTTVAAQTVGVSLGLVAQRIGINEVRVKIRGIRTNRLPALTGLAVSGLKIVSITDDTKFHYGHGLRPRKPRRT